jgi:hypothetical protein
MREIEKVLRFAKRTVNDLVVVLARPSLQIAPKINADEPGARFTRNNLSCFGRKTLVPERRNHAGLWLIDGVRSTSSAEVFDTSVLSWGLSLTMSFV